MSETTSSVTNLATFRKFADRLPVAWPEFLQRRQLRLVQQERYGKAAEKVAENIIEDFFTVALDWATSDLNYQLQRADIVFTRQGIRRLLIEAKYPGSLKWNQPSFDQALGQARRYAEEQRVHTIAVSDGTLLYAADIQNGGLVDRARLRLDIPDFSLDTWWMSVDGIYRPASLLDEVEPFETASQTAAPEPEQSQSALPQLLHPKYGVPAECFAYVGDASKTATWKLPCRLASGAVDEKHLSGAVRAVLSNYRGAHVSTIPEAAVPDVLVRLGKAAAEIRKLPTQTPAPLSSYQLLYDALHQLGRLEEVLPVRAAA